MSALDVQLVIAHQKAEAALGVIGLRGYTVPAAVTAAFANARELEKIVAAPATTPPLSEDPKKLRASLTAFASAARDHQDMLVAADAARPQLVTRAVQAARQALPQWLEALSVDFKAAWDAFSTAQGDAPEFLHSSFSDEQAVAHLGLLRSVADLDAILEARVILGDLVREDGCDTRNVLLAAGLPTVPDLPEVENAWAHLGNLIDLWQGGGALLTTGTRPAAQGVAKWAALAMTPGVTPGLADIDTLEARLRHRDAWTQAVSTVHARGGMPFAHRESHASDMWHDLAG